MLGIGREPALDDPFGGCANEANCLKFDRIDQSGGKMVSRNILGVLAAALLPLLANFAIADSRDTVEVLETPNYLVRIDVYCEDQGGCEKARYVGTDKRTGKSLTLAGGPTYRVCGDGTLCQWTGYEFVNGQFTYSVYVGGVLMVRRGEKVLLREEGIWKSKE